jgi:hypothetical protein
MDQQRPPVLPLGDTGALGPAAAYNEDADLDGPADRDERAEGELPAHEIDDERTMGGGLMSEGGTAIDRGTGTLSGEAQGPDAGLDSEDVVDEDADVDETQPSPYNRA